MIYKEKLLDPRWQKKRLLIFKRDKFTCQSCGEKGKTLHAHHSRYFKDPWDIEDNYIITLCCDCHEYQHLKNVHPIIKEVEMYITTYPKKYGSVMKVMVNECLNYYKK